MTILVPRNYKAKSIEDPYYDLDATRLRYFGGSTNHWGGYCRTFNQLISIEVIWVKN